MVFDEEESYIENKWTGERLKIEEEDGDYVLDVWVKTGEDGEKVFGGRGEDRQAEPCKTLP